MPSYAVVGASRGIGLAFIRQLALDPQNTVFAVVRNKSKATHLTDLVSTLPARNVHIFQADVTDHRALKAAAGEVAKITGGALDVLTHNAARMENTNLYRGLTNYDDEDQLDVEFIESFKVNVLGAIHSVNAFLPLLRAGTTKKIVIISSEGGQRDFVWNVRLDSMAAYGVTKAAESIVATKYAALLEGEGFTVVALCPGLVDVSTTAVDQPDKVWKAESAKVVENMDKAYQPKLLTPEESVKYLLAAIASVGPADNGSFWESRLIQK